MPEQLQSPEIQAFATGFPLTLLHFAVTTVILFLGAAMYVLLTPHREIALIRDALQMTHKQLAAACGSATNWIDQVLAGGKSASPLLLCRMAQVVGISAELGPFPGYEPNASDMLRVTAATSRPALRAVPNRELLSEVARRMDGGERA